ncbi:hypothetical protein AALP_AA7G058600 [Arabis alpina]|uniref:Uncharacterized protein n=1 Tax=Arabis alpina TaxID=50452 RepID=A0A087GG63_ARAAL|nr:hypothetical protein AALP_AA7G058600 [Arabis alpina]
MAIGEITLLILHDDGIDITVSKEVLACQSFNRFMKLICGAR